MSFACLIDSLGLHVINVIICAFIFYLFLGFFFFSSGCFRNQIKTLAFSDLEVIILLMTCFYYSQVYQSSLG